MNPLRSVANFGGRAARRVLGPIYPPMRRVAGFLTWILPSLVRLLLPGSSSQKRLLLIYDTSCQPFSIGDILHAHVGSLVLREKHQLDAVDFALLYDSQHPASSDPAFSSITETNALYHLASILPVAQVNQHLGSLFLFDSQRNLQRFVADNADVYRVWPSGWKFGSRTYLFYDVFNDLLYTHYKEHGSIPRLTCRKFLVDWAHAFYQKHVNAQIPVTVNARNNKTFQTHRNLHMECWLEFFRHCETRYPAKFIVLCARSEIDERLRQCPNVIVAKDHDTGIEQDLALIHTSAIHMGASSGPFSMALFGDKPCLMVNTVFGPGYFAHADMIRQEEENIQRFWFSGTLQRIAGGIETTELLVREFARMWAGVDISHWQSPAGTGKNSQAEVPTWLR
jgi:hypothetical protein